MRRDVIVFLGPSLPLWRARPVLDADYRPPARQGDVFRALAVRPRVLVLIDGVFEGSPPVWHHELRAALAAGVEVLGASSMGALRAAELKGLGMRPVGRIAAEYASGARVDDADVALLHGDADSDYRALTVPLVNVEATLERARHEAVLSAREAAALRQRAAGTFYKERTWRALIAGMPRWSDGRRTAVLAWVRTSMVDQKAIDALEALRLAARLAARRVSRPVRPAPFSSFVRRRRLQDVDPARTKRLTSRADAEVLAVQGVRRMLVAAFASMAGIEPTRAQLEAALESVDGAGLGADEHVSLARLLALETLVCSRPERFVADGPTRLEGLHFEARLRRGRSR